VAVGLERRPHVAEPWLRVPERRRRRLDEHVVVGVQRVFGSRVADSTCLVLPFECGRDVDAGLVDDRARRVRECHD